MILRAAFDTEFAAITEARVRPIAAPHCRIAPLKEVFSQ